MAAPRVPPLCRETQSLGQQMLNAPVDINGLRHIAILIFYPHIHILSVVIAILMNKQHTLTFQVSVGTGMRFLMGSR